MSFEDAQAYAESHNLQRVDKVKTLGQYIGECWKLRRFTYQLALSKIIASTAQNRLGLFWEFLTPLLMALMYYLAFGVLLGTRADSSNFIFFLVSGVLTFNLFMQTFQSASLSLVSSKDLAESLLFPRVLIPIASGLQSLLRSLPTLSLLYPFALLTGITPTWWWLLLPFQLLLTVVCGLTFGLLASRAVVKVRDIAQAIPLLARLLMFTSGIFFDVTTRFETAPQWIAVIATNSPTALLLDMTRGLFIRSDMPFTYQIVGVVAGTITVFSFAFILFWRGERRNG